jgi:hypothetical protein
MQNDVARQFQLLNKHIATAIGAQDYARAYQLDRARQEILQEICLMDMTSVDENFFALVEECARDNANLIQSVQKDMDQISWHTNRSLKAQRAYSAGR